MEISLANGGIALVSDEDFYLVSKFEWKSYKYYRDTYYASTRIDGKVVYMHRMILPGHPRVDHINHDGLDNQRHNLRGCTHQQNRSNTGKNSRNTSGYKGVFWDKNRSKWLAAIGHEGRMVNIGRFSDIIDAAKAYDAKAIELKGEFALLNFPK
jgi:hypothetical protein